MKSLRSGTAAVVAALAAVAGACGGDAFSAGPGDAGGGVEGGAVEGGLAGDGGGEGGGDASDGGDAATGDIVYVSTATGADTNVGTDPSMPKKTIASALSQAAKLGAGAAVHVCAGNYAETSLTVNKDVSLLGSYDCGTWKRTATYGFPVFDAKNATVVSNAAPSMQAATLVVVNPAVTPATVIDGFVLLGATGTTGSSFGVDVQGAASPKISNNAINGSANMAPNAPYGSVGIRVGGTSTAEVSYNVITGGSGGGAIGSIGVAVVSTAAASVHDDIVSGGTGVSNGTMPDLSAVGVGVFGAISAPKALSTLLISGTDSAGASGKSVGLLVSGTGVSASIVGCEIEGGNGLANGAGATSTGIDLETTGDVSIVAARVYGGTRLGPGSQTTGVHAGSVGGFSLADSEVHAGEITAGAGSASVAVSVGAASTTDIVDDTLYAGSAMGSPAIELGASVTGAVVSGDILLGGGASSSDYAILVAKCPGALASIDHTAFVNFPALYQCSENSTFATDPGVLAATLGPSVVSATNVEVEDGCGGGTTMAWCVADGACPSTPPTACAQSLFGSSFSSGDDGLTGLFDGPPAADGGTTVGAWSLQPGAPCALAHQGAVNASIPDDLFGNPRGAMPSMGAVQYAATLPCAQ